MDGDTTGRSDARRKGWLVLLSLAVLTVVEFIVSVRLATPLPYLTVIALAKAALIVVYFMRLGDLSVVWRQEVSE